jgi:GT2 family glycosyltransferase
MTEHAPSLSVGITTRNRPESLLGCLRSIRFVAHLSPDVVVFDDASSIPAEEQVAGHVLPVPIRIIRDDRGPGYIVGRNRLVRESAASAVLLLDDDSQLLDNGAVEQALRLLDGDDRVAAVAFAQADRHGAAWDAALQASRSDESCYVPSFIGFAHLLRKDVFARLGGYRESFEFYGEEKEFCLRLMEAGYRTVYLPDALIVHEPDQAGRSKKRYLRYVTRNDCFNALYNEPWWRLVWLLPARLALFFRMRRAWDVDDRWGWAWIVRELAANAGAIVRDRRPVSPETVELWKRLRMSPERYGFTAGSARAARVPSPDA